MSPGVPNILTFHAVERKIAKFTGIEYVEHNMCTNSCVGFTGLFADLMPAQCVGPLTRIKAASMQAMGTQKLQLRSLP